MSRLRKKIIVIVGMALAMLLLFINLNKSINSEAPEKPLSQLNAELVREFNDSYPEQIEPGGNTIEMDLVASEAKLKLPEGNVETLYAYNNQIPGPELRLKLGDTLRINFKNDLPQETTIHFHGVRVPNAMDGVPGVTQPPIEPGGTFTYEFTPKDAGTFWYHPHVRTSEQVEKGLYGSLIVEEVNPMSYSQEVTWIIDDWRLDNEGGLYPLFNTRHDLAHDGRWGQYITVNGNLNEVLSVKKGERIRLRLINASNARIYRPYFGELNPRVIAVDGMGVKNPFAYTGFDLAPGNRLDLDLVVDTENESVTISDLFTRTANKLATINVDLANPVETPVLRHTSNKVPEWREALTLPIHQDYRLNARRGGEYGIEWTINDRTLDDHMPLDLQKGEFYRLRFTNESSRLHPMHLHGQFFRVLARNGKISNENYWRDTVLVKPKEVVDIGLIPIDKGSWVNHCHILEHAAAGMTTVVNVE